MAKKTTTTTVRSHVMRPHKKDLEYTLKRKTLEVSFLKIIENHTKVKVDNINLKKLLRYQILTLVQLVDDYRRL